MTTAERSRRMTEAEYLAWEADQVEKHEYVNGEIVAMSGVSLAHAILASNLTEALQARLRGTPCRVFGSDLRVRINETGLYAYPDLTVVCGSPVMSDERPPALLNPRLVVEVLSASTEAWDLGPKAAHYRHRASVDALLFVDSRARRVTTQARNPDGTWTLRDQVDGEVEVLGLRIPMEEVYRGWEAG